MQYTKVADNAFQQIQINAGIICKDFKPATGEVTGIMGVTTGGFSFAANPAYDDFGADMDNVPANTKQLKRLTGYDPTGSGTFITVTPELGKMLIGGAAYASGDTTHIIPATGLKEEDFQDVWIVGDYSDKNEGATTAGFVAIHIMNALNTSGFQMQTSKGGKGQFAFEFHGHYDLSDIDKAPFEIYIKAGTDAETTGG